MSHNYYTDIVKINASDKQIINCLAEQGENEWNGESECLMSEIIAGMNVVRATGLYTESEARDITNRNDDFYWGSYIKAIPFAYTENARTKNIQQRINETQKKYYNYIKNHRVADFKSAFVGCSSCNSKINKDYFIELKKNKNLSDYCPVCREPMMSNTMKQTLESYRNKIDKLKDELDKEQKRIVKKPTHLLCVCGIHS